MRGGRAILGTRRRWWLLLALLPLAFVVPASRAGEARALEAGFAVVDITPSRPVPLGGYGARLGLPFREVHDPVKARAVVLRRGDTSLGLVSLDLVGVTAEVRRILLRRVTDLGLDDVVLAATHTHTGPGALTDVPLWKVSTGGFDPHLLALTVARVEAALRLAYADLAPARVAALRVEDPALARLVRNRATPGGAVDASLGVLRIDAPDGTPRGILVHFAAHAILAPAETFQLSAGWPGALCDAIERRVPGATAILLQGALGDVSPVAPPAADDVPFARVRAYGEAVADAALAAFDVLQDVPASDALRVDGTHAAWGRTVAGALLGDAGGDALVPPPHPMPVARFAIGDVELVTVPGEPVTAVGKTLGQGAHRWVVSCAQDHLGYFADRALYRRADGYEAEMSFFGPDAADLLAAAARGEGGAEPDDAKRDPGPVPREPVALAPLPGEPPARGLGLAHGRALRPWIRRLLREAGAHIERESLAGGAGAALLPASLLVGVRARDLVLPLLVRAARRLQRHVPAEFLDEMEGIAEAAGVPYDAVLLENVFLTLAEQPDPSAPFRLGAHCTNVVALGPATSMGQVLHASTLDWGMGPVLGDLALTLVLQPADGAPFASVTWPGMVGTLRAMGAQGLAVTEESCSAGADTGLDGTPIGMLLRRVVQHAAGLDAAVAMVCGTPGTCGYKITLSDGRTLDARVVEVTATRHQVRRPVGGLLFGCDPGAPDEAFVGARDASIRPNDGSSARRYPAIGDALRDGSGRLRLADLEAGLALRAGGVLNRDTLLACVFEPQLGRFHVALGDDVRPAAGTLAWRTYRLRDLLPDPAAARDLFAPWPVRRVGPVRVERRIEGFGPVDVDEVHFVSPVPSGVASNDRFVAELFTPKEAVGVVILLPHWKDAPGAPLTRLLSLGLAGRGIAVLALPLPYQQGRAPEGVASGSLTLSADLARTRQAALQGAADVAQASLWLERERGFAPARQGIVGLSLGAHVASLALGAYPDRFRAGVFVLAAAGIEHTLFEENGITDRIRRRLHERGVTPEEAADLLADIDPARHARPERRADVLLVDGENDPVTPAARVEALARAWGGARIDWFPGGHHGVARHAGRIMEAMVDHLRERFGAP